MSELLPCPFCKKGKAYTIKPARYGKSWGVLCECGAFLGYEYTEAEAIARWNSRAERTCYIEGSYYDELMDEHYTQLSCDHETSEYKPNYCPTCGARVVGRDAE